MLDIFFGASIITLLWKYGLDQADSWIFNAILFMCYVLLFVALMVLGFEPCLPQFPTVKQEVLASN